MRTVSKMKDRKASLAFRVIVLVFLIVYAVALMFPYFWAFVSSLKDYDGFKEYTISFIQGFRSENIFESYLISIEKFGKKITMTTGGQRFVGFLGDVLEFITLCRRWRIVHDVYLLRNGVLLCKI